QETQKRNLVQRQLIVCCNLLCMLICFSRIPVIIPNRIRINRHSFAIQITSYNITRSYVIVDFQISSKVIIESVVVIKHIITSVKRVQSDSLYLNLTELLSVILS